MRNNRIHRAFFLHFDFQYSLFYFKELIYLRDLEHLMEHSYLLATFLLNFKEKFNQYICFFIYYFTFFLHTYYYITLIPYRIE